MKSKFLFSLLALILLLVNFRYIEAQWQPANGPYGGLITSLCNNGSNIFAGTSAGVYKSTNAGNNWTLLYSTTSTVETVQAYDSIIYLSTISAGFHKSTDYGLSWFRADTNINGRRANCFLKSIADYLLAGTNGSLYKEIRNGYWALDASNHSTENINSLCYSGEVLFIGTTQGLFSYQSVWVRDLSFLVSDNVKDLDTAGGVIYASGSFGIRKSTNSGTSWSSLNNDIGSTNISSFTVFGSTLLAGSYAGGLFRSTNGGMNWIRIDSGFDDPAINCILSSGTTILAGTSLSGLYLSANNGISWNQPGLMRIGIQFIESINSAVYTLSNDGAGLMTTTDNGSTWKFITQQVQNYHISSASGYGNYIYITTEGNGVYRTSNNGLNWNNLGPTSGQTKCVTYRGDTLFAGLLSGVMFTTDLGANWSEMNDEPFNMVYSFYNESGFLYVSTPQGVFRTSNCGQNWIQLNSGMSGPVTKIFAHSGNLFALNYTGGIFMSSNGGMNWISRSAGMSGNYFNALISVTNGLLAGTDSGFYMSTNSGLNWIAKNEGLPANKQITSLTSINGFIFSGTYSNSVYRRPISEIIVGIEAISGNQSGEFSLAQNFPNPFNPLTKLKFSLATEDNISILIYDINGRLVSTLIDNRKLNAGEHSVIWNAAEFSSGIYFCRLSCAKSGTLTSKLVLMK